MTQLCLGQSQGTQATLSLPEDWTHHHVIFGGKLPDATVSSRVLSDPRFLHQTLRRFAGTHPNLPSAHGKKHRVDWSVNLGAAGAFLAAGTFPAKFTFDINASPSCPNDFAVFALDVAGSATQATIVAYNNLYAGTAGICTGPTVLWAYNTGGAINTSPVLSLNGKKVAWISNANPPVLHVLTIGTSGSNGASVITPATPGSGNNAVDAQVSFGTLGDTRSSLFVDYSNDVGYAASDDGKIHKFSGIFNGTVAEITTGGWPVVGLGGAGRKLTGIVYDSVSGNLFYGDDVGNFAYVRETSSTLGVCLSGSPPCLGKFSYALGGAIVDAPVIDTVTQNVFAFVGNNGASHAIVQQADTQLSTNGPQAPIGENGGNLFAGTFDNNYYVNASNGFLYVCGYPAASIANPTLYRIGFNSSASMNITPDASTLPLSNSAGGTTCSPITEIFNAPTLKDWLFVGVGDGCTATGGGSSGCVMSLEVTSGFPGSATQGRAETAGTSGIVVDNVSTQGQASSIYFTSQGAMSCTGGSTGGCAVKMTQSGLN